jgi:hypothetical protein
MEDAVEVVWNARKGALTIRVDAHQRDCERAGWPAVVFFSNVLSRRHRPFGHKASAWIFKVPEIAPWVVSEMMLWLVREPFSDCSKVFVTVARVCCMVRWQAACYRGLSEGWTRLPVFGADHGPVRVIGWATPRGLPVA